MSDTSQLYHPHSLPFVLWERQCLTRHNFTTRTVYPLVFENDNVWHVTTLPHSQFTLCVVKTAMSDTSQLYHPHSLPFVLWERQCLTRHNFTTPQFTLCVVRTAMSDTSQLYHPHSLPFVLWERQCLTRHNFTTLIVYPLFCENDNVWHVTTLPAS